MSEIQLYREEEAGLLLQVSRTTLFRLRTSGELSFVRIGNQVRYREKDLKQLIDNKLVGTVRFTDRRKRHAVKK